MEKLIEVTKEDIREAEAHLAKGVLGGYSPMTQCLIATTFKRVFPRASKTHLYVGVERAEVGKLEFALPKKVQNKINAFISGKHLRPFSFILPRGKRVPL